MLGSQMSAQRYPAHPAFKAHDVVGVHRSPDRHRRNPHFRDRRLLPDTAKRLLHGRDQARELADRDTVMSDVTAHDVGDEMGINVLSVAGEWIASATHVLAKQAGAATGIRSRSVGARLSQHLDPIARGVDCHHPETEQPAKPPHPRITISSSACRRYGEPHFVRRAHPINRLQQQVEAEAELHFDDRQPRRLFTSHRNNVATANLALHLEARRLEKALYGRIERGLGHRPAWGGYRRSARPGAIGSSATSRRPPVVSGVAENALDGADRDPIDLVDLGNRHAVFHQGADAAKLRPRDRACRLRLGVDRGFDLLNTGPAPPGRFYSPRGWRVG